jgi:hypothetical protein
MLMFQKLPLTGMLPLEPILQFYSIVLDNTQCNFLHKHNLNLQLLANVEICNGQGDPVDNLYLLRVKSTLTRHKQKHLHLYQINGQSRLGSSGAEPIQVETRISNNLMWNRKLAGRYKNGGKMNRTKKNTKHDKNNTIFSTLNLPNNFSRSQSWDHE